jgi:16S rRNA (cytosine967-C5)-methyltransferase
MTPAARIDLLIDLLELLQKLPNLPMDKIVGDFLNQRRFVGSKDRRDIVERLYNITRSHARLGWWLQHISIPDTPRHRVLLWLCLGEGRGDHLDGLFLNDDEDTKTDNRARYAATPLTHNEKKFISDLHGKTLIHDNMPEWVQCECPEADYPRLKSVFGDDFAVAMQAMLENAPLDMRTNLLKSTREKALAALRKLDRDVSETPYSPWGIRASRKIFLSQANLLAKGWVDIQDEGSQLIALLANVKPSMQVLDYCAGAGGKTLALAAMMQNKGRIVAMDLESARLEKSRNRLKRAGVHNYELRPLSDEKNRKWLRRQKAAFDVVLLDVPCSGSGTWRRNPDMRWRNAAPDLEILTTTQADILERVADKVKVGGHLVYGTCSLFQEENEHQIKKFLQNHPDYEIVPIPTLWAQLKQDQSVTGDCPVSSDFLRLFPHTHQTDGFFTAVLKRTASPTPS